MIPTFLEDLLFGPQHDWLDDHHFEHQFGAEAADTITGHHFLGLHRAAVAPSFTSFWSPMLTPASSSSASGRCNGSVLGPRNMTAATQRHLSSFGVSFDSMPELSKAFNMSLGDPDTVSDKMAKLTKKPPKEMAKDFGLPPVERCSFGRDYSKACPEMWKPDKDKCVPMTDKQGNMIEPSDKLKAAKLFPNGQKASDVADCKETFKYDSEKAAFCGRCPYFTGDKDNFFQAFNGGKKDRKEMELMEHVCGVRWPCLEDEPTSDMRDYEAFPTNICPEGWNFVSNEGACMVDPVFHYRGKCPHTKLGVLYMTPYQKRIWAEDCGLKFTKDGPIMSDPYEVTEDMFKEKKPDKRVISAALQAMREVKHFADDGGAWWNMTKGTPGSWNPFHWSAKPVQANQVPRRWDSRLPVAEYTNQLTYWQSLKEQDQQKILLNKCMQQDWAGFAPPAGKTRKQAMIDFMTRLQIKPYERDPELSEINMTCPDSVRLMLHNIGYAAPGPWQAAEIHSSDFLAAMNPKLAIPIEQRRGIMEALRNPKEFEMLNSAFDSKKLRQAVERAQATAKAQENAEEEKILANNKKISMERESQIDDIREQKKKEAQKQMGWGEWISSKASSAASSVSGAFSSAGSSIKGAVSSVKDKALGLVGYNKKAGVEFYKNVVKQALTLPVSKMPIPITLELVKRGLVPVHWPKQKDVILFWNNMPHPQNPTNFSDIWQMANKTFNIIGSVKDPKVDSLLGKSAQVLRKTDLIDRMDQPEDCRRTYAPPCPAGWRVTRLQNDRHYLCDAPESYKGICPRVIEITDGLSYRMKQAFQNHCNAPWPCDNEFLLMPEGRTLVEE